MAAHSDGGGRGQAVLERLASLPGGPQVLQLAAQRGDVALVGGAVRDLLRGVSPREIDLVIDGESAAFPQVAATFAPEPASFSSAAAMFARELATLLTRGDDRVADRPQVSVHERFGTAVVSWSGGRVDIATRRSERYPQRGALPEVSLAGEEQDLRRRDFTVNAIAVTLGGEHAGAVRSVAHALDDLQASLLRVLHSSSFEDDPTRLMRLARYSGRLGFTIEPGTAQLATQALQDGALATVSGARIGAELRLALSEPDPIASLIALQQLGVLAALQPPMSLEPKLLQQALALLPDDGRPDLLALGCLLLKAATGPPAKAGDRAASGNLAKGNNLGKAGDPAAPAHARDELLQALERWEQPAAERRPVIEAATNAYPLREQIASADSPSELWELLSGVSVEAIALAGAVAERDGGIEAKAAAESWLQKLRHARLQITGDDLLAAGVQAGPEVGERLAKALRQRLDGTIEPGREAELQAALR
jgi:tRNA nucleotidyltransferase (CCA-adding enzyme)